MKKSDDTLRQAQEDMEQRKRLLVLGKIRVDPEPPAKSTIKQKDQEKKPVTVNNLRDSCMIAVPGNTVAETVELARESGSPVRKKPEEIYDNSFVNNLEKSGFLKEIWGSENYKR